MCSLDNISSQPTHEVYPRGIIRFLRAGDVGFLEQRAKLRFRLGGCTRANSSVGRHSIERQLVKGRAWLGGAREALPKLMEDTKCIWCVNGEKQVGGTVMCSRQPDAMPMRRSW